jgi:hypothetical protein
MCMKTRTQFYFPAKAGPLFLSLICFQQQYENIDVHQQQRRLKMFAQHRPIALKTRHSCLLVLQAFNSKDYVAVFLRIGARLRKETVCGREAIQILVYSS